MIIHKLSVIMEKMRFLQLLKMESAYLVAEHDEIIYRNLDKLREDLGKIRQKGDIASSEDKRNAVRIEAQINETEKTRQMIDSSEEKAEDIEKQISFYWKNLFR
jgi:hypothetical protein